MRSDVYELSFKFGMMIDTCQLCDLAPIWMTLTFNQDQVHEEAKPFQ